MSRPVQDLKRRRRKADRRAGYTLTEMIVVIVIIALLVALVGPQVWRFVGQAQGTSAETQMESFATALEYYRLDNGRFPDASVGLDGLVRQPPGVDSWDGPYIRSTDLPLDPWGEPYRYEVLGADRVVISTLGRDKQEGGEGDDADLVREVF